MRSKGAGPYTLEGAAAYSSPAMIMIDDRKVLQTGLALMG